MKKDRSFEKQLDYTQYIPKKYSTFKNIFSKKIFNEHFSKLAKLKNVQIPLTAPELSWLKTIMQDLKFDLFVTDDEKESLAELVKDVEPFDLSAFKIYDSNEKTYKSITDFGVPEDIDRNIFTEKIKELNTILFNTDTNSFPELSENHSE